MLKDTDTLTYTTQQAEHSEPIIMFLTWLDAWSLMLKALSVSSLQLSFRHPSNKGFVRQHAGDVCALLEQLLAKTPVLEEVIRRGRNPQYDSVDQGSHPDETPKGG